MRRVPLGQREVEDMPTGFGPTPERTTCRAKLAPELPPWSRRGREGAFALQVRRKRQRRPISRVLFPERFAQGGGHFSRAPVTRRLQRPNPRARAGNPIALLFGLAPGGVCRADAVTRAAGELLPHRFTLTALADGGLLSVALIRGVPPPGRYPAPCPVEPGLSSRRVAATGDRPAFSGAGESIPRGAPFRAFDEDVAPDEHVAREAGPGGDAGGGVAVQDVQHGAPISAPGWRRARADPRGRSGGPRCGRAPCARRRRGAG